MSMGFSPTWTTKGSDRLRSLQTIKILINTIHNLISSFDLSSNELRTTVTDVIAATVYSNFTPHRELKIEDQFDLLADFLGWKTTRIERDEAKLSVILGANRFLSANAQDYAYQILTEGILKALGFMVFNSNVRVEQIPSQFQSNQIQVVIYPIQAPIPHQTERILHAETIKEPSKYVEKPRPPAEIPQEAMEEVSIRASIDVKLETIFSPIFTNFSISTILPIFHQVIAEIMTTYFKEIEDNRVKVAKKQYTEENIKFLIEFMLLNASDVGQQISELSKLIGQYVIKALKTKTSDDLTNYLPAEITSTISRRVSYVEFPARAYCTYAPGEKCVAGKRDLCDFVLHLWEGMLKELLPDKSFTVEERIPATRRGKFCLAEFLKESR
ncbi:MAG: hypothetical protein ACTSYD_09225 [Candidatus Heimdallarchaeaceae archaeon]